MNYNTFDDIENDKLRAFNRLAFLRNLIEDVGEEAGRKYLNNLTLEDRLTIVELTYDIKNKGVDAVRLELSGDVYG